MIKLNASFDDNSILSFFIQAQSDPRGQVQFCHNLILILFENGNSPCKQKFPKLRIKRQILDRYLRGIRNTKSYYGIFTIEILSPKPNHPLHQIQTDDMDKESSKVFTDHIKNIEPQISQRANSISTNEIFSFIYGYLSILELKDLKNEPPTQTSRHSTVRQEI